MKKLIQIYFLLLPLIAITGCAASYFVDKSEEFKEKAIKKGAIYESDTTYKYITVTDTIIDPITHEVEIIKRVIDSIPYSVERLVYVPMSRQERLAYKDSLKYANKNLKEERKMYGDSLTEARKMHNSDNKTEVKINRCNWWIRLMGRIWWIPAIIAFTGGFILRGYWSRITSMFK